MEPALAVGASARGSEACDPLRNAYAFTRPVANAYLVRERDRRRVKELVMVLVVVASLGIGLLAYTWIHLQVLATGYRIEELEQGLRDLTRKERELRLQGSYLESPQMVEERATNELGLKPPEIEQVVFWEELH